MKDGEISAIIKNGEKTQKITFVKGKSLWNALTENGIICSSVCGGKGICGKCAVKILEGSVNISAADAAFFSPPRLDDGFRLSCTAYPESDITAELFTAADDDFSILAVPAEHDGCNGGEYAIAADIGTTTLALALLSKSSKKTVCVKTLINPQRKYGADVISRINAAAEGKEQELTRLIRSALKTGFDGLISEAGIKKTAVTDIVVVCNTVMCHLFMGYDCKPLGVYPFKPFYNGFAESDFAGLFGDTGYCAKVTVLPAVSAYIGADIVAGLYYTDFYKSEENNLFIDLGTNGEIALGNKNGIVVCSAAAGPAFEGGNISCGTGSVSGAISSVEITNGKASLTTVNAAAPVGICGTGVIDAVYELIKNGIVDETGFMCEPFHADGYCLYRGKDNVVFTQNDVRQIQLAKSAVSAAAEALFDAAAITCDNIKNAYISGGFGTKLNIEKAAFIGLLSNSVAKKATASGNTALLGAIKYAFDENGKKHTENLVSLCREVSLAESSVFNEAFVNNMLFENI